MPLFAAQFDLLVLGRGGDFTSDVSAEQVADAFALP